MFKKKPTTDIKFIKERLSKEVKYYNAKALKYKALYEKEEQPYVKLVLKKTWLQFVNVAVEMEGILWQFDKTEI